MCYADFILLEDCPSAGSCCDLEPSFFFQTERQTPLQRDVSFISVNVPHRTVTSTLSSGFLLCLFLKNWINSQQSFCQRVLFWNDILFYPFILFYFCIFEMFLKIYRGKKKQNYRKQLTEEHRAVARKIAPLGSEPQWRLWEERTEHREHRSRSQNTACASETRLATCKSHDPKPIMSPPGPPSENTHFASLRGILGQLNEL